MYIAFFHANIDSTAVQKCEMTRNAKIAIKYHELYVLCVEQWLFLKMRSGKSSGIDENAFDVPFRFAMKSINFKCLTTAISVDWWNKCRVHRKKGRTHYVGNQNNQIIVAKTTFDRWKRLITASMKNNTTKKPYTQFACRWQQRCIDSNMQQPTWMKKKLWPLFFYSCSFLKIKTRAQTCETKPTDNTKGFAGPRHFFSEA